jgi:hypothetical protein
VSKNYPPLPKVGIYYPVILIGKRSYFLFKFLPSHTVA